jgi:hypothetical protein
VELTSAARLGVGGLVAVIATSMLAGCSQPAKSGNLTPSPSPAQAPVPYAPIPYPGKPTPSGPLPTPPPAATVACTLADLQVTGWSGGYLGDVRESVDFTDTSSAACYIAGAPAIQLTLSSGGVEPVALGLSRTPEDPRSPR